MKDPSSSLTPLSDGHPIPHAGLFGLVFTQLSLMTPITGAFLGAIAFLVTGLCIAASTKVNVQVLS